MDLSGLTAGLVAATATKNALAGTKGRVVLINFNDYKAATIAATGNVISAITLVTGKKGYMFDTREDSVKGECLLVKGTYMSEFEHKVSLRIFTETQESKTFVEGLKLSRVVAIVENRKTGTAGEVKWEAYGTDAGLELMAMKSDTDMADKVVYDLELGSSAKSKENSLPKSVYTTSIAATDTMITGLTA